MVLKKKKTQMNVNERKCFVCAPAAHYISKPFVLSYESALILQANAFLSAAICIHLRSFAFSFLVNRKIIGLH